MHNPGWSRKVSSQQRARDLDRREDELERAEERAARADERRDRIVIPIAVSREQYDLLMDRLNSGDRALVALTGIVDQVKSSAEQSEHTLKGDGVEGLADKVGRIEAQLITTPKEAQRAVADALALRIAGRYRVFGLVTGIAALLVTLLLLWERFTTWVHK